MSLVLLLFSSSLYGGGSGVDTDSIPENKHLYRNLLIGNVAILSFTYVYAVNTWGAPDGKFHLKDDLDDNLAMTDEVSHFFVSYKLSEGCRWLFRITGMQSDKIEKYSLLEAGLLTSLVEFPMDAYNPDQGFGISDFVFNWAGIGFSWLRHRGLESFDVKFSLKRSPFEFENKVLASRNEEFSNFIWWSCWKPRYVWLGAGYSTNHESATVESEYYLGIGTTLYDLIALVDRDIAAKVKALDSYFINVHLRL
jgi:hypothetical protein